jgi:hypothetical protein
MTTETNFYDDAEFAAISAVRIADAETPDQPASSKIVAILHDIQVRHGQDGVDALVVALSRQYSAALAVVADHQDVTATEVIDKFELHKMQQIDEENQDAAELADAARRAVTTPEDLATFLGLDAPTRNLVLRLLGLLDGPTEADHDELARHPQSAILAGWLLTLPAYRRADRDDEGDDS